MRMKLLTGLTLLCTLAGPASAADANPVHVVMETSKGTVEMELDAARAPKTVQNFVEYAKAGFFNGTIFHRVIPGFMAQGGGFTPQMAQKDTRAPIQNEADNGLKNLRGTLAMARTGEPNSATAQFFINLVDNDFLNHTGKNPQGWGYAVFGKVTKGMDVVDAMAQVPTTTVGFFSDVPETAIEIKKMEVK